MSHTIRPATKQDVDFLAPRLREEDVAEIRASVGLEPHDALFAGLICGRSWVGCYEDVPYGMFGASPAHEQGIGLPWMLATPELLKHQVYFLRTCRKWVDVLQDGYELLWNVVDARNTVHIKWLRWCGFTFINLLPHHGVERRPFYEFIRIQPCALQ